MDKSNIDIFLENNRLYADGQSTHKQLTLASNPTSHPDARRVACMDARHDVEDLRVCSPAKRTSSAMRGYGHRGCDSLPDHFAPPAEHQRNHPHPPHPLRDAGLYRRFTEGWPGRRPGSGKADRASHQSHFRYYRQGISQPNRLPRLPFPWSTGHWTLRAARSDKSMERLAWDVRRGMSTILNHPWLPTTGPDAVQCAVSSTMSIPAGWRKWDIPGRWVLSAKRCGMHVYRSGGQPREHAWPFHDQPLQPPARS